MSLLCVDGSFTNIENLPGGQLPLLLWCQPIGLLSSKLKEKKRKEDDLFTRSHTPALKKECRCVVGAVTLNLVVVHLVEVHGSGSKTTFLTDQQVDPRNDWFNFRNNRLSFRFKFKTLGNLPNLYSNLESISEDQIESQLQLSNQELCIFEFMHKFWTISIANMTYTRS